MTLLTHVLHWAPSASSGALVPGAAAAEISSSARPEAATGRTTRVQSSDLTLPLKTRADSFMIRRHGGARVAERT